ncbi:MAG TPA: dihydrodipicolinate synthase family protein [Candidatus Sumerlaeota bacterium]|nr:dihydrodipicolinate synthase family protein [Candidatus Sumerlaeota bacterium]
MTYHCLPADIHDILMKGVVIPASPLALDAAKRLDEVRQRALYRYYAAAGAGGVAVGVHTTQFEIREPRFGLFEPLLRLASDELGHLSRKHGRPLIRVAGICGPTSQAVSEAQMASSLGYHIGLLSLAALRNASEEELIAHCRAVGREIPLMGFYLQPAVGGRALSRSFWTNFFRIEQVVAVKMAPFNRYATLDVIHALAASGRHYEVVLYTGNDDNIVADLLTPFPVITPSGGDVLRIRGGLLGQWSVWTSRAVELLRRIHQLVDDDKPIPRDLLQTGAALTEANAAIFDARNGFRGCIAGIHEILRRQGLLQFSHALEPAERLSPGQTEELDRVCRAWPFLTDDDFVRPGLDAWLKGNQS